jgi:hypothetical protein
VKIAFIMPIDFTLPILDRFQDCFDPLCDDDVRELQQDLGVAFPNDYVEFLLKFNCAYMRHPVGFAVRHPGEFVEGGTFDHSYGVLKGWPLSESGSNIRWQAETFEGRVPQGLVPIGSSGPDAICMAFTPSDHGKIFLWDSIDEGADDNTYLVADSFAEFMNVLYPDDESFKHVEELPIFQQVERGELTKVHEYLADGGKAECRNEHGQTLLMCAARTGWPKIVQLLLQRGAQPNACDSDQCTPVYHAAMGQSNDSLKLLLAAGASAQFCDDRGRTLVKLAEERSYHQIVRTLEKHLAER